MAECSDLAVVALLLLAAWGGLRGTAVALARERRMAAAVLAALAGSRQGTSSIASPRLASSFPTTSSPSSSTMIPLPGAGRRGDIAVDRARAAAAAAASASSSPPLDSYAAHAHAQLDALASGIGLSSQQQAAQQQQLSRRSRSPPASSAHASSSRLPTTSPSSGIFVPRTSRTSAGVRKPLSRCSESELEGISERADSLLRSAAVREKLAPAELERLRRDGEEARRRLEDIRRTKEEEKGRREEVRLAGRMEELELREESASPRLTNSPAMLYGRSPTSNYALGSSPTHTTEARRFVREREQVSLASSRYFSCCIANVLYPAVADARPSAASLLPASLSARAAHLRSPSSRRTPTHRGCDTTRAGEDGHQG